MRYYGSLMILLVLLLSMSKLALNIQASESSPISYSSSASSQSLVGGSSDIDWWPMFQHDPAHTGNSSSQVPETNDTLWTMERTGQLFSSPAVVHGRVFIGSRYDPYSPSYVLCVNSSTGRVLWRYESTYSYTSSFPGVFDEKLVVSSGHELLYLNISDGQLLWNYTTQEFTNLGISPVVSDGKILVSFSRYDVPKQGIRCLNATDGSLLWEYETHDFVYDLAAINGIAVGNSIDNVYCVNASTGAEMWIYTLDDPSQNYAFSSTSCSIGKIFVGSHKRNWWTSPHPYYKLFCLDSSTGVPLWVFEVDGGIYAAPAVAGENVFFGISRDAQPYGKLYCLNASNGSLIREHTIMEGINSALAIADNKFVLSLGRKLCVFNQSSGELLWSYDPPGGSQGFSRYLAIAEGRIYIGSRDDGLYCFGPMLYFNIAVNPRFYDNRGEPLVPTPFSWTILFPNGTRRTASSVETYFGPMGTYSIESVVWKGFHLSLVPPPHPRITPASFFLDSNTTWSPRINCTLPTSLSLSLSSSTSYIGFRVGIDGNLTCNEIGVSDASILLSYSVTAGESWNEITLVDTTYYGRYSAVWMPQATGNYVVKAIWAGNSTYPGATQTINLAVTPFEEQNIFSVTSNSTISELIFNSTSRELSFTVSGPSGTTGYVNVYVAKTLVENAGDFKVYLNGTQIDYTTMSTDDSWLLHFTYQHSTYKVTITLARPSTSFIETPFGKAIIYIVPTTAVAILIALYALRKRARARVIGNQEKRIKGKG